MTTNDIRFIPHSDMSIDGQAIVNQHQNLIKNNEFGDAITLLNNKNYKEGFRASLFNTMQDKVRMILEYLLTKNEETQEEIISKTEPINSEAQFWLADY